MRVWLFVLALLIAAPLSAKFWYTAPGVTVGTGGGTIGSPWALQDALVKNSKIQAGDTLYLRGGTYTFAVGTNLLVGLTGAISNRIVVDAYPGEHPVLDLKNTRYGMFFTTSPLASGAQYVDFKNIEFTDSRTVGGSSGPPALNVKTCNSIRFIYLVAHNMWSTAWSFNPEAIAPESYGLIDYLNGCGTGAGHGHGLYYNGGQGSYRKGTAIISFNDGGAGIHYFPHRGTSFTNPLLKDSVTFYSGKINGNAVPHANVIMGGDAVSTNPITDGLYTYQRNPSGYDVKFGYSYGCTTPTISNSYIVGTVLISGCSTGFSPTTTLTFANNTIITTANQLKEATQFNTSTQDLGASCGGINGCTGYSGNTKLTSNPTTTRVFVLKADAFEQGRSHVVVYNWHADAIVTVDLSTTSLRTNDTYAVYDVQDYVHQRWGGGTPTSTGTYGGTTISIPITSITVEKPNSYPALTDAEGNHSTDFKVFVIVKTGSLGLTAPRQIHR